jgi:hypothetical protein
MRPLWYAAGIVATAAALTACSPSESGPQPVPSSTSPEHGSLAHCLSEHGIEATPGPAATAPPGVDQDAWQRAMQACATLAPGPADSATPAP